MANFRFMQCNIQSLSKNKDELQRVLTVGDYSAAFLSETWSNESLEQTSKYDISRYNKFLKSRLDGYGGCAIYLKQDIGYTIIDIPALSNATQAVAIKVYSLDVILIALYIAPSILKSELESDLSKIFSLVTRNCRTIIAGDFNAHHHTWGNDFTDTKGSVVMDLINDSNLILLNDNSKTFIPIQVNRKSTAIDLTLCTPNLFSDLEWKTLTYGIGSHHLIIETNYNHNKVESSKIIFNHKKINEEIKNLNLENCNSIEYFQKIVADIYEKNKINNRYKPKHWWSKELSQAWEEKNEARSKFNRRSTTENLIICKKAQAKFNRLKKNAKNESFKSFVEEINPTMTSSELWLKIGRLTGKQKRFTSNSIIQEDKTLANIFLDKHFGKNEPFFMVDSTFHISENLINLDIFNNIINSKKRKSSAGGDKITYSLLRQLQPEAKIVIIKHLNDIWKDCYLPMTLKTIKIVAIPKPGKDQSNIEGKRPISLVPVLTKIINSAVLTKLQKVLDNKQIIPDTSFGFRKNMSTITCSNFLVNTIKQNKRDNFLTAVVFIDLSNAFNAVKTDILENILINFGIPGEITSWIVSFLRNRKIAFNLKNHVIERFVSNGLPQGDVLSPTLFNLYTASLHNVLENDVVLVQYADDFAAVIKAKNLEILNNKAQQVIDTVFQKLGELNFSVNAHKTKAILFQNSNNILHLKYNNTEIETVKSHPYLGITLDRYMSFGIHIKNTKLKIIDRLNMIKVISGMKQGAHPQTMVAIYNAIFRSVIEYGASIFNNAGKTNRKMLSTINNQCLRRITGCTKTTPLNSLVAVAATQTLDHRHELITCREIARAVNSQNLIAKQLITLDNNVDFDKLTYLESLFVKEKHIFESISPLTCIDISLPKINVCTQLETIDSSKSNTNPVRLKQAVLCLFNGKYKNRPKVFTDASKIDKSCGIGIFVAYNNSRYSYKLELETCITTAELIAIDQALSIIDQEKISFAVIYTDSKSSCLIINSGQYSSKTPQLVNQIIAKAVKWNVSLQWIPSHTNITGNETADSLARTAISGTLTIPNCILLSDAFGLFKNKSIENTNEWYREYAIEKGKQFYQFQKTVNKEAWYFDKGLSNQNVRLLNRLITGHDWSKYWRAKMKLVDSELCEICDEPENGEHVVLHCVRFGIVRSKYSFDCRFRNLIDLFNSKNIDTLIDVCKFLKEINMDI